MPVDIGPCHHGSNMTYASASSGVVTPAMTRASALSDISVSFAGAPLKAAGMTPPVARRSKFQAIKKRAGTGGFLPIRWLAVPRIPCARPPRPRWPLPAVPPGKPARGRAPRNTFRQIFTGIRKMAG